MLPTIRLPMNKKEYTALSPTASDSTERLLEEEQDKELLHEVNLLRSKQRPGWRRRVFPVLGHLLLIALYTATAIFFIERNNRRWRHGPDLIPCTSARTCTRHVADNEQRPRARRTTTSASRLTVSSRPKIPTKANGVRSWTMPGESCSRVGIIHGSQSQLTIRLEHCRFQRGSRCDQQDLRAGTRRLGLPCNAGRIPPTPLHQADSPVHPSGAVHARRAQHRSPH